jgi:hypothetical protein
VEVAEHLREAVFHAWISALVVEALRRLWRVADPSVSLRLRLLALLTPCVLLPTLELGAPFRHEEWFSAERALFVGRHWDEVRIWGLSLVNLWLAAMVLSGVALLLVDLVPWLVDRRESRRLGPSGSCPAGLEQEVRRIGGALGVRSPTVEVVASARALLMCRGGRNPTVTITTRALEVLDSRELEGALAHELAHLALRDVWLGWVVLGARMLQAFNPVAQVLARAIALDLERRADEVAARVTGHPAALASALVKVFFGASARSSTSEVLLGATVRRAREAAIEERCRRLLGQVDRTEPWEASYRLAATAVATASLLFFVT